MALIDKLENYSSCNIWLEGFKSKSTKRVYTIHLLLSVDFVQLLQTN
jgi:hypothetical protein